MNVPVLVLLQRHPKKIILLHSFNHHLLVILSRKLFACLFHSLYITYLNFFYLKVVYWWFILV